MRILLDENFPKSAVDVIEAAGHEVIPFVDVCEFGADDEVVFESAQNLGAVILTSEGFHSSRLLLPGQVSMPELQDAVEAYCDMSCGRGGCWREVHDATRQFLL